MDTVFVLLAVSSLLGLVLGFYFSWLGIGVSGVILAFLSAVVLRHEDFGSDAGVAIIVACLTVNQLGCLIGVSVNRGTGRYLVAYQRRNQANTATNHIAGE